MAVLTYVDLSTAHVSRATMALLDFIGGRNDAVADSGRRLHEAGWPAMTVAPYECGVFISVPNADCAELGVAEAEARFLPLELTLILAYARRLGATLVCLDADAERVEGLQLFDW